MQKFIIFTILLIYVTGICEAACSYCTNLNVIRYNSTMQKFIIFTILLIYVTGICEAACSYCTNLNGGKTFKNCVTDDTSIITRQGSTVSVVLTVDIANITYEWLKIKRRTYNGKICGPTIRVKKGDTLKILLTNRLGNNQWKKHPNQLRWPNTTNIYLHGLHISSKESGNDVFTHVDPGRSHNYTYQINKEQPAGTYWYHAHLRGSSWFHVMSGLSGLLVVDDDVEGLDDTSCPNNCKNDIHILMQPILQYMVKENGASFINIQEKIGDSPKFRLPLKTERWLEDPKNSFDNYTVNGLYFPKLTINKNELKRFRLVNAGGYDGLELEIVNRKTQKHSCSIREIAYDGVYFDAPRNQRMNQSYLAAGARVDWLIYCSEPGTYILQSTPYETNKYSIGEFRRFKGKMMTIVVEESTLTEPKFPETLPSRPPFVGSLSTETENKFTVEFSADFYINRKKFTDETDFRYQIEVGSVLELTLLNTLKDSSLPIHIHVNHFQVISYNNYTGPISDESLCYSSDHPAFVLRAQSGNVCQDTYAAPSLEKGKGKFNFTKEYLNHTNRWNAGFLGYAEKEDWRDVLNLPPLSNVTVRLLVDEYIGTMVIACHVLKDMDMGMMMTLQIKPEGESINNSFVPKLDCDESLSMLSNSTDQKDEIFYLSRCLGTTLPVIVILLLCLCWKSYEGKKYRKLANEDGNPRDEDLVNAILVNNEPVDDNPVDHNPGEKKGYFNQALSKFFSRRR